MRAKKRKDTAKWNVSRVHRSIFYRLSNGVAEETEREEKWAWKIVGHITRSACGVLYNVCLRRVLSKYTTTRSWRIGTLAEKDTTTILGRPQVNASSTFMYVLLLGLSESRRCFWHRCHIVLCDTELFYMIPISHPSHKTGVVSFCMTPLPYSCLTYQSVSYTHLTLPTKA